MSSCWRPPPPGRGTGSRAAGATIDVVYATIDVVYVVDCGRAKMKMFDPARNFATLRPEWISRANARQRMGRAGRSLNLRIFVFLYFQAEARRRVQAVF